MVYGINRRALLSTLDYFGVASGALIPDIMHGILEGGLPLEVKLMLKVCVSTIYYIRMYIYIAVVNLLHKELVVDEKLFTLGFIDEAFVKLNIRSCDGDKRSPLYVFPSLPLILIFTNLVSSHNSRHMCTCME